jgi:hypothetical protein
MGERNSAAAQRHNHRQTPTLSYGNNSIDGNGDRETAPPSMSLK